MKILLVPNTRRGMGSGHLRRCLRLAEALGGEATLLLEQEQRGRSAQEMLEALRLEGGLPRIVERFDAGDGWDLVVLDRKETAPDEYLRFFPIPALGLDEGGGSRPYLPYLIDTPLGWGGRHEPNLRSAALLDLPQRRAVLRFPFQRVLVSFGGEDRADLSRRLIEALLRQGLLRPEQLTVVQGPFFREGPWREGVRILANPKDLKQRLADYDLVFTLFGNTAFEALASGVPVILLHPSLYHRKLGRAAGFPDAGVRKPKAGALRRLLSDRGRFERLLARYPEEALKDTCSPAGLLSSLRPSRAAYCPLCSAALNRAAARFAKRTYFRCSRCGILYLISFGESPKNYGEEYFFQEYKSQYGKTYLEDFDAIKAAGLQRLRFIRRLLPPTGRPFLLLDVGCAYGPFLDAARDDGFAAEGLDVSPEAAEYVREKLRIPCAVGDFESSGLAPPGRLDALTLWYVLEHFREPAAALRRANRLLRKGGVLAFSTPSAAGISARRSLRRFLEASPADHATVWSPRGTALILRRFGFRLRRLRITGHHPERFPEAFRFPAAARRLASRLLALGDTFEAYAVKIGDPR